MSKKAAPARAVPRENPWRLPAFSAGAVLFAWWLGMGIFYYRQPALSFRWDLATKVLPNPFAMKPAMAWELLKLLGELAWLIFLGASLGAAGMRRLGLGRRSRAEQLGFGLGLGWGALACALAVLGMFRLWYPVPVFSALAALTLLGALLAWRSGPQASAPGQSWGSGFDKLLLAALALLAAFNLFAALMPEIFYDALSCHL
jgi:hypothetical protein